MSVRRGLWLVPMLLLAACSGSSSSAATHLRLSVTPASALWDAPVAVTVRGAPAGSKVTLATSAVDRDHVTWKASAVFRADSSGVVSTAQAPVSGSYHGANAMGLFQDLAPKGDPTIEAAFYARDGEPATVTITAAVGGRVRATTTVSRLYPAQTGVRYTALSASTSDGLVGEYAAPKDTSVRRPAVLVLGGSEGGASGTLKSGMLASHGYPALSLAYFAAAGRPAQLHLIPLEYFATALRWLAKQPGVDLHRLVVWGVSRGSEAALLTGSYYPSLVAGVVATSPSDIAYGGIPDSGTSAWSYQGKPVPFALESDFRTTVPSVLSSYIPITRIRGPIFAGCGKDDTLWPSCGHVDSIVKRLAAAHSRYRPTVLEYPGAGHGMGSLLPQIPETVVDGSDANGDHYGLGGSSVADEAAKAQGWAMLLRWLAAVPG